MCGRYSLTTPGEVLEEEFDLDEAVELSPRHNICPTEQVLVISQRSCDVEGRGQAQHMRWGLIPSWTRKPSRSAPLINARCETLTEKPSFRDGYRERRCLVPLTGYYEWAGKGLARRPFLFRHRDEQPMAFAGLWETWFGGTQDGTSPERVDSVTLLTTEPNQTVAPFHHRMPVLVGRPHRTKWLQPGELSPEFAAEVFAAASAPPLSVTALKAIPGSREDSLPEQTSLF